MAGHAQLKFVMTECSKTQIRLTGLRLMFLFLSRGPDGKTELVDTVPDTITSWVVTAFAVHPETGLGLSPAPANVSHLSHVTRKSVFGGLRPGKTQTSLLSFSIGIILSRQRKTKALISLRGCASLYRPLSFAYGKSRFFHDMAHFVLS